VPLLAVVGLVKISFDKKWRYTLPWLIPSAILFLIANIWILQPWAWDNTKYFVWSSVGFSGVVGWLFVQWWDRIKTLRHRWLRPLPATLVGLLLWLCIWSGVLDAYRIQRVELHHYQMYSAEDLELTEWVKHNTDPNSVWLTGNNHNHWLFNLTGRQTLMAYPGWLWTHGYQYRELETEVAQAYRGGDASQEIIKKYSVTYAVIGPSERHELRAHEQSFLQQYPVVFKTANTKIFDVTRPRE
jgi:hypothetical protein